MKNLRFAYKDLYVFFLIIYIICLPLNAIRIGAFGSALKIVAILPIGAAFLGGKKLVFRVPLRRQLAYTVFCACSIMWSVAPEVSAQRTASYVLLLLFLISGSMFRYTDADIKKVGLALAWSSRLTAAVMIIFAEYVDGRFRLMGIVEEDPNYLCAYLLFGVVYALGVLTAKNKARKKIFAVAELILYFYLVLISGSRGGLLAVGAAVVMYLLTYGDKNGKNIGKKVVLLAVIFVLLVVMVDQLPDSLRLRFTVDNVIERGGAGRVDLWEQTIDLFANTSLLRQFFGQGIATIEWCFLNYGYDSIMLAHNMFLETLAELGVVGLIIYSAAIYSFIKAAFKNRDKFAFAVVIGMFVMSVSASIYAFKPYFNIMLFIVMLQNRCESETEVGAS